MVAKQTVRFPLGAGGVDRKSDLKHVPPGKFEYLENIELRADGSIRKRRALGTSNAPVVSSHIGTLVGGRQRYLVEELPIAGGRRRFVVERADGTVGAQKPMGGTGVSDIRPVALAAGLGYDFVAGQVAWYAGNMYGAGACTTPGSSNTTLYVADLSETASGSLITTDFALVGSPPGQVVRLVTLSNCVCVIWGDSGATTLYARRYADGAWLGAATSLLTSMTQLSSANAAWDAEATADGTGVYVAIRESASATKVHGWTYDGSTFSALGSTVSITVDAKVVSIAVGTSYVAAMVMTTGAAGSVTRCDLDLVAAGTAVALTGVPAVNKHDCGIAFYAAETGLCAVWSDATPDTHRQAITTSSMALYGTLSTAGACTLAHKPVSDGANNAVVGVRRYDDDTAPVYQTLYCADVLPMSPIAAYGHGLAQSDYPAFSERNLSAVSTLATDTGTKLYWAGILRHNVRLEDGLDGAVDSGKMLAIASLDMSVERGLVHASAHETLLVAGSLPTPIVGGVPVEASYSHPPRIVSIAQSTSGSGGLGLATYSVKAVFELIDERGRLWRSQPSTAETITLVSGNETINVVVERPMVRSGSRVNIALYMTTSGGTSVHYRAEEFGVANASSMFDSAAPSFALDDNDAVLSGRDVLYTDLGELEHAPAPPCFTVCEHKQRFAAVHSETGDIWLSLEHVRGEGVHWSPVLTVLNPDRSDKPTALVSTDSALVVFYRDRIGFIYGDGPSNQGLGQPFSAIQFLPDSDVGAVSQKAVQKMPMGIFFLDADKGFHVMPYGGGPPQYVGRDVDGAPDAVVVGTAHLPDRHEIRVVFYNRLTVEIESGSETVNWMTWHYDRAAWSYGLAEDHASAITHATADGNTFIFDGVAEKAGRGYDGTDTYVQSAVRTAWISLSQATRKQGLFRLWSAYLFARSGDDYDLSIKWYFDYNGADVIGFTRYVDDVTGDRLKIFPPKQLIESFKLALVDFEAGGTTTAEGFELSDMELHFGLYPGVKPRVSPADVVG